MVKTSAKQLAHGETPVELRRMANVLRRHIINMLAAAQSGHPGGSLSATELVTGLYFGGVLRYDPANPTDPARDRFILSKGHGVPVQYAALAEAGFFEREELQTLRDVDSRLQGHPVLGTAPGIEASTGSLGQGLSIGLGMALAARMDGAEWNVWVLMGDGECQEGQVWEAAMAAGHHAPDNLMAIVDYNRYQLDGAIEDIISLQPLADKWRAMGWEVKEIDGHDMAEVMEGLKWAQDRNSPACLIAHTIKGAGVSFMENENAFHGVAPSEEERLRALSEFDDIAAELDANQTADQRDLESGERATSGGWT